jgi:hypothetical protein
MCELSKALMLLRSPFLGFVQRVQFPKGNRPSTMFDQAWLRESGRRIGLGRYDLEPAAAGASLPSRSAKTDEHSGS